MIGVPKIARKAEQRPALPLEFDTELTVDDWTAASLVASRPLLTTNRRRILTVLLPMLWFGGLLGSFAAWRPARSRLTLTQFTDFLSVFIGDLPVYVLLAITAGVVILWLLQPWLMRRRMRQVLRAAGFDRPIPLHYVLSEDGLVTREPLRESFTPWGRIREVEDGPDHIFLVMSLHDETIALPKRVIPPGEIASLQDWLREQCGVRQELPAPPASPPEALVFEVRLGAADRAAHVRWYQDLPAMRRKRLLGTLRGFLLASLAVPVLAIVAWMLDPERLQMSLALPIFWSLFPTLFWKPILFFAALALLRLALDGKLMSWFTNHTGKLIQQQVGETLIRFAVDENGILSEDAGSRTRVAWAGVERLVALPEHWLLRISRGSALIVPRASLDAEQAARFEALCSRHIRPTWWCRGAR